MTAGDLQGIGADGVAEDICLDRALHHRQRPAGIRREKIQVERFAVELGSIFTDKKHLTFLIKENKISTNAVRPYLPN